MKAKDISIGGRYIARVSGRFVTVRVDERREQLGRTGRLRDVYDVTNLDTGRKLTFSSAQKFRGIAEAAKVTPT